MEYVLRTFDLTKRYKDVAVVEGVSMSIRRGEIYGFVGRNGAGKTTLMRLICGLIGKSGGGYELFGKRDDERDIGRARRRMGAMVETPSLFPEMTAVQNLTEHCLALGVTDKSIIPSALEYVGLHDTGNKKVRNFSLGMRQRLGIALTLVGSPDFIVLDEPVNGLDPQGIVEIRELLLRLNRERHITILISSHILGELSRLATCYGFIEKGRLLREITAEELEQSCRKSVTLHLSSTEKLPFALEQRMGITDYKILSAQDAEIYGDVHLGDLAQALQAEGIDLLRANEKDEDLESYFLNLVGGGK